MDNNLVSKIRSFTKEHMFFLVVSVISILATYFPAWRVEAIDSMPASAQVYEAIYHDESPPLRDILPLHPEAGFHVMPLLPIPHVPLVSATDPVLQSSGGPLVSTITATHSRFLTSRTIQSWVCGRMATMFRSTSLRGILSWAPQSVHLTAEACFSVIPQPCSVSAPAAVMVVSCLPIWTD